MIENDNQKLGYKESLSTLSSGLKRVLNPAIFNGSPQDWIKINTDLKIPEENTPEEKIVKNVGLHVKGLAESNKVIQFDGYLNLIDTTIFIGNNRGSSIIEKIAFTSIDDFYTIAIKGTDISQLSVELFIYDSDSDNKNHVTGITTFEDGCNPEDEDWYMNDDSFDGESAANWYAYFDTDNEHENTRIDSSTIGTKIDKIKKSATADKLKDDISINLTGDITGSGTLNSGNTSVSIETTLSDDLQLSQELVENIANLVEQNIEIPLATDEKIGGIQLYSDEESEGLADGYYPLQLNSEKAYVDLRKLDNKVSSISGAIASLDIHRFSDLDHVPDEVKKPGMIALYIGTTSNKYIKGYFYQYTPISFNVQKNTNKWGFTDLNAGPSIAIHNVELNYKIVSGNLILKTILEEGESVTDETIFLVIENGNLIEELSYLDLQNIYQVHIEEAYKSKENYSDCTLILSIDDNTCVWTQINVQPLLEALHVLVYRGTVPAFDDLEAKTPAAQPGDVWTVLDNRQEYFYKESESIDWQDHWEFMGLILDVPEYKDGTYINVVKDQEGPDYTVNCTLKSGVTDAASKKYAVDIANTGEMTTSVPWVDSGKTYNEITPVNSGEITIDILRSTLLEDGKVPSDLTFEEFIKALFIKHNSEKTLTDDPILPTLTASVSWSGDTSNKWVEVGDTNALKTYTLTGTYSFAATAGKIQTYTVTKGESTDSKYYVEDPDCKVTSVTWSKGNGTRSYSEELNSDNKEQHILLYLSGITCSGSAVSLIENPNTTERKAGGEYPVICSSYGNALYQSAGTAINETLTSNTTSSKTVNIYSQYRNYLNHNGSWTNWYCIPDGSTSASNKVVDNLKSGDIIYFPADKTIKVKYHSMVDMELNETESALSEMLSNQYLSLPGKTSPNFDPVPQTGIYKEYKRFKLKGDVTPDAGYRVTIEIS